MLRTVLWVGLWAVGEWSAAQMQGNETGEAGRPEAHSLLGKPLYPPELNPERQKQLETNLAKARAVWQRTPDDPGAVIWLGRRTAYLGRYREAIRIYSEGIANHPRHAPLYRHRGHRYISVREFDNAITDLEKAVVLITGTEEEIEPDGLPNPQNKPRSTLHSNIWYHLGLAYYLKGQFEHALRCYQACIKVSTNDDMLCATSHWYYMTLRRLGREQAAADLLAPIQENMDILENHAYHRLLLMYKGLHSPDDILAGDKDALTSATEAYGVANWYLYQGQHDKAKTIFQTILAGTSWPAFGYIAAEAEWARLR